MRVLAMAVTCTVLLASCDGGRTSTSPASPQPGKSLATSDPDTFLKNLMSTNAIVVGTRKGASAPEIQLGFSNGFMESGAPGKAAIASGRAESRSTPNATCIGFTYQFMGEANEDLCMTVRDFEYLGNSFVKGDLYIATRMGDGSGSFYRAKVVSRP